MRETIIGLKSLNSDYDLHIRMLSLGRYRFEFQYDSLHLFVMFPSYI